MPIILRLFLFGLCFCCQKGMAQSRLNPEAHTHGMAQMTVLYEAGQLLIELETPAANILGFEHSPQNTEQWQRLNQRKKTLTDSKNVVILQPDCKVQSVKVELPFQEKDEAKKLSKQPAAEHPSHAHGDDHKSHHAHNNHDYDTHSGHNAELDEAHQDIHLSYAWQCNGLEPPTIKLQVFILYPDFEKIQAQWITNGKQGTTTLDKNHVSLELKP